MTAPTCSIGVEELIDLLRRIAHGEILLAHASEESQDAAVVGILRAGSYTLYLLKDAEGSASLEHLKHEDGRVGDIEQWFAATEQLPLELLSEAERVQLIRIMETAAGLRQQR